MDIVAFIEEYFGIQLLTYQKLQLRMLMMEYAKYEGKARPMIEILEKGTRKQCTCENCGAELSYEKNDIKNKPKRTIDFRTLKPVYPPNYIICPQCKHPVEVEVDEND